MAIGAEDAGEAGSGGGSEDADAERADEPMLGLADELLRAFRGGEDGTGFVEKNPAGRSQFHAAGGAFKKGDAQFRLQSFYLCAEGRLGDVETLGRAPKIQFLGDNNKIAKMSQFHGFILTSYQ